MITIETLILSQIIDLLDGVYNYYTNYCYNPGVKITLTR